MFFFWTESEAYWILIKVLIREAIWIALVFTKTKTDSVFRTLFADSSLCNYSVLYTYVSRMWRLGLQYFQLILINYTYSFIWFHSRNMQFSSGTIGKTFSNVINYFSLDQRHLTGIFFRSPEWLIVFVDRCFSLSPVGHKLLKIFTFIETAEPISTDFGI